MKIIECVKCEVCGKLIDNKSNDFIVFHGNVTVGLSGGVIGNADNTKETVCCRNWNCIKNLFKYVFPDEQTAWSTDGYM